MLPKPIWCENGRVYLIEQTKLPLECNVVEIMTAEQMWDAIKRLEVRGAPAIGLAGAYGVYLGIKQWAEAGGDKGSLIAKVAEIGSYLDSSRPTAVNLHWAVQRMRSEERRVGKEC